MFYSQFILAKKGPLGTIWIAAHLERKLRKNQVADTDIGVSVDSILFPDVPIALRLSSHLLLGVVRIYSRKVNYLFNDCSEALLKIKQAFRSTAVDLPPEESTAPYHSITLPETFDLDDFELPDNAFFHGNYVDHHVSAREQITLQDTMEGMVYSTSQFGLDERFGDGEASQIGLDLDEDLFMEKVRTGHATALSGIEQDVDPETSAQQVTFTDMDIDGVGTSKDHPELAGGCGNRVHSNILDSVGTYDSSHLHDDHIHTPDLNEEIGGPFGDLDSMEFVSKSADAPSSDLDECAQAPSTPGLMTEAVPSLNPFEKASPHDDSLKATPEEHLGNPRNEQCYHVQGTKHGLDFTPLDGKICESDIHPVQNMEYDSACGVLQDVQIMHLEDGPSPSGLISLDTIQPVSSPPPVLSVPKSVSLECSAISSPASSEVAPANESVENFLCNNNLGPDTLTNVGLVGPVEDSCTPISALPSDKDFRLGSTDRQDIENPDTHIHLQACCSAKQSNALPLDGNPDLSPAIVGLCAMDAQESMAMHVDEASAEMPGNNSHSADVADVDLKSKQMQEPLPSEIRADINMSDERLGGVISNDNQLESSNCSAVSEIPAPETLLLAPAEASDLANDVVLQSTTGEPLTNERTVDRLESLSGKKRRLMERTPLLENRDSSKFSRMLRSRSSMDYIPDDDDVLASILVGKRTPILKMRPTPPPARVISSKRPCLAPRTSVLKRKVLLDDTMILNGDLIRQQLTNTEDIRRIRRKAPCTQKEIWMTQKYSSEEEIFSEPLFTGMSAALAGLQNQMYHLSVTGVNSSDAKQSQIEAVEELEFSKRAELLKETGGEGADRSMAVVPDKNVGAAREPTETVTQNENETSEHAVIHPVSDNQEQIEAAMHMDMPNEGANDALDHAAVTGVEIPIQSDLPGDGCNVSPYLLSIEASLVDRDDRVQTIPQKDDGSCLSPDQKLVIEPTDDLSKMNDEKSGLMDNSFVEKDASIPDTFNTAAETIDVDNENLNLDKGDERDESVMDETKDDISYDVMPVNLPQDCHGGIKEVANEEILTPLLDNFSVETGSEAMPDSSMKNMNRSVPEVAVGIDVLTGMTCVTDDIDTSGVSTEKFVVEVQDEDVAQKMTKDAGNLSPSLCMEETQIASSCPLQLNPDIENDTLKGGGPGCQDGHLESATDMELPVTVISAEGDSGDFGHILDENDTEFLNVDEEAELVEEDENMPTGEEDRFIENSGWSTRTRAVARYLRSLFDNETGRGMKTVPVDNLLAGKTRKEASRMFFETLVLKTKDYIHVEQDQPYEKINIQPREKIMKSEF